MATEVQLKLLISAVDRAGRSLNQIASKLRKVKREGQSANKAAGDAARKAKEETEKLAASLGKVEDKFKRAGDAARSMSRAGAQMAAAGAAFGAAAFFPIKEAATFEEAMSRVKAVTTETQVTFEDLEVKARDLGRTTQFTASEAAAGMRFLGMAGLDTTKVLEGIGPALDLAAAGELELAEAADIATNVMSAYQLSTKELPHIMDVLAATAASSNTSVRELAEGLSYAGPTAAAAGVSLEETAARLGLLANNGIKASRAGTNLRGVLAGLLLPTPQAEKALAKLGVVIEKNEDGTINMTKAFEDLGKAGLTAEQAFRLFRRTAGAAGIIFARQTEGLGKLNKVIEDSDGAAKKMRKTMEDNLPKAVTLLKSAFSGLLIVMGGPMLDGLKALTLSIADTTTKIANWIEKHPLLSKVLLTSVAVIGSLMLGLGLLLIPLGLAAEGFIILSKKVVIAASALKTKLIPYLVLTAKKL